MAREGQTGEHSVPHRIPPLLHRDAIPAFLRIQGRKRENVLRPQSDPGKLVEVHAQRLDAQLWELKPSRECQLGTGQAQDGRRARPVPPRGFQSPSGCELCPSHLSLDCICI